MTTINLPYDIIDNIITSNPYAIISLFNKITKNLKYSENKTFGLHALICSITDWPNNIAIIGR